MIIYGAGLAGLLAGNMLRGLIPVVKEGQSSLPNNHSALLRFRTDKVGTACAIKFKKVKVNKAIKYNNQIFTEPNLFLSNLYSQKVTGSILTRSINNLEPVNRYIAPTRLISMMAENCDVEYNQYLTMEAITARERAKSKWIDRHTHSPPIISTIPMPTLMKIVGWDEVPDFPKQKIWTERAIIEHPHCDVYQTIYYPDELSPYYRISVIGNVIISEAIRKPDSYAGAHIMGALRDDFGIKTTMLTDIETSEQEYGKIMPIDEKLRKEFIYQMTTKYNIYSVGRFATWRQLLLDDVVEDIQHIEHFIRNDTDYSRWIHSQKGEGDES
jgi:hypothetical protein